MKYKKYKLNDVCEIKIGRTPPRVEHEWFSYDDNDMVWVSIKDMGTINKYIDSSSEFITHSGVEKFNIPIVDEGTVLLSFKLTVGKVAISKCRLITNEAIAQLPIKNKQIIDRDYLYYYLKIYPYQSLGSTSSIANAINSKMIKNMEIELPDIKIQHKISKLLSKLDERIDLNNKINKNLLELILSIYSKDFDKSISRGKISDYCNVKSGYAFKSSCWKDTGIPVIKIGTIEQDRLNENAYSYISDEINSIPNEFKSQMGDVVIAMTGATIGKFCIVPYSDNPIYVNQRVGKFDLGGTPINRLPFLYATLKQYEITNRLKTIGQGSAQPNMSALDITSIDCILPNDDLIEQYNIKCKPFFQKIIYNNYQNKLLSNVRDSLLPKLMSGELDVSNINI